MTFQFNPGGCCCPTCVLFEDDFERADSSDLGDGWQAASGAWSIASGQLQVASGGGRCDATTLPDDPRVVVEARVTTQAAGDTVRLVLGRNASGDFWFVELKAGNGGWIRVGRSVGGVDDVLASRPFGEPAGTYLLRGCYDGDVLRGVVATGADVPLAEASTRVQIASTGVGLAVGAASGAVLWDSFRAYRHNGPGEDQVCPRCRFEALACCGQVASDSEAVLDLTGFALANEGCDRCAEIAAEYALTFAGVDGWIEWTYFEKDWCCCVCPAMQGANFDCGNDRLDLLLRVQMTGFDATQCRLLVDVDLNRVCQGTEEPCATLHWRGQGLFAMEQGCSGFEVTVAGNQSGLGFPPACSGSFPASVTVRL